MSSPIMGATNTEADAELLIDLNIQTHRRIPIEERPSVSHEDRSGQPPRPVVRPLAISLGLFTILDRSRDLAFLRHIF